MAHFVKFQYMIYRSGCGKCFKNDANQDILDDNFYYYEEVNTSPMANYSQSAQFNATFENVDTILVNNETIAVYTEVEMGEWDHHLNRATSPSVECSLPDQHQSRHIKKSPSPSPVYAVVQKR